MAELNELRKRIEDKKKPAQPRPTDKKSGELIDVDSIVKRMQKQYESQGLRPEKAGEKLEGLRGEVEGGKARGITLKGIGKIKDFNGFWAKALAATYLGARPLAGLFKKLLEALENRETLKHFLYSANQAYTTEQYLALGGAAGLWGFALGLAAGLVFFGWQEGIAYWAMVLGSGALFALAALLLARWWPRALAKKRADLLSAELPYALRHMATELKAGIGLYKTLQAISVSDYGALSEEFARTVNEVEEGTETREALANFADRTESTALKRALQHIGRAMKTGGNLSGIMDEIAEDVSFELRMRTRDFAEKMNFFGVVFIVMGIVLPVFVAIIAGVTNAPIGMEASVLTPEMLAVLYLLVLPALLVYLIIYLAVSQPKV